MDEEPESISYLSADDIRDIHELIVESNTETTAGVSSPGDIEYVVEHIQEGHFGQVPESLHEKAFQLLGLLRRIIRSSMAISELRSCRPEFSTP